MDFPGINELVVVTEDQFRAIRATYNATSESLKRDVDSLIDWYKLQPHLPQVDLDRKWLERILIGGKCSIERTKRKIDMMCWCRTMHSEILLNRNPKKSLGVSKKSMMLVPLPKLATDNTRVIIFKLTTNNGDLFNLKENIKSVLLFLDYRTNHDYYVGLRCIVDTRGFNSSFINKLNPVEVKKALDIILKCYGTRITSIHVLFTNSMLQWIVGFIKLLIPSKLAARIKVYPDLKSLHQDISKHILPMDYGGAEKSSNEIFGKCEKALCSDEIVEYFQYLNRLQSDESKRIGDHVVDEMFGMPGSFRSLQLD